MTSTPQPWYRHRRNQVVVLVVIVVIAISALDLSTFTTPKTPTQAALDRTVAYFVRSYNFTVGLVPGTPAANTFWIYSDNYLASLALQRYDPSNQSTSSFALAISEASGSYKATLSANDLLSQYTALNSTSASFSCAQTYTVSWASLPGNVQQGGGSAMVETTANNGASSCGSLNYVDTILLQAIYHHVNGNGAAATSDLRKAASLFDGAGFADLAYTNSSSTSKGVYQTYKLALYVIASECVGAASTDTTLPTVEGLLTHLQDNSTGGFYSGYTSPGNHGSTSVNTETTALGALALEAMIDPSASC